MGDIGKPLSSTEIESLIGPENCRVLIYKDLQRMGPQQFYNLMRSKRALVCLYPGESDQKGHWCLVFMYPNSKTIEFFDPLGKMGKQELYADQELKWNTIGQQKRPILKEWLKLFEGNLEFNPHQIQKRRDEVNTCGRHCVVRYLFGREGMPIEDYYKFLMQVKKETGMDPDQFVSRITNSI